MRKYKKYFRGAEIHTIPETQNKGIQFVIFKPLGYCFEETIGFDVKASFPSRPESSLIRRYNKPGDITKGF